MAAAAAAVWFGMRRARLLLLALVGCLVPLLALHGRHGSRALARAEDVGEGDYAYEDEEDYVIDEEAELEARAQGLHDKALELAMDGKEGEALPLFYQAAELQPENAGFHSDLGVTQMRVGLLDQG